MERALQKPICTAFYNSTRLISPLYKKSLDTILYLVYICAVVGRGYLLVCGKDKYACKFV